MSRRSKMPKIKEILRLGNKENLSLNAIGKSVGCSHNTVKEILRRSKEAGLNWQAAESMSDDEIECYLYVCTRGRFLTLHQHLQRLTTSWNSILYCCSSM